MRHSQVLLVKHYLIVCHLKIGFLSGYPENYSVDFHPLPGRVGYQIMFQNLSSAEWDLIIPPLVIWLFLHGSRDLRVLLRLVCGSNFNWTLTVSADLGAVVDCLTSVATEGCETLQLEDLCLWWWAQLSSFIHCGFWLLCHHCSWLATVCCDWWMWNSRSWGTLCA